MTQWKSRANRLLRSWRDVGHGLLPRVVLRCAKLAEVVVPVPWLSRAFHYGALRLEYVCLGKIVELGFIWSTPGPNTGNLEVLVISVECSKICRIVLDSYAGNYEFVPVGIGLDESIWVVSGPVESKGATRCLYSCGLGLLPFEQDWVVWLGVSLSLRVVYYKDLAGFLARERLEGAGEGAMDVVSFSVSPSISSTVTGWGSGHYCIRI